LNDVNAGSGLSSFSEHLRIVSVIDVWMGLYCVPSKVIQKFTDLGACFWKLTAFSRSLLLLFSELMSSVSSHYDIVLHCGFKSYSLPFES